MGSTRNNQADPLIGREIDGRFVIRRKIGAGGMGSIYSAWQASVEREVAVKVIHARLLEREATVQRFLREAKLASQLSHPNTVGIFDFGRCEDGLLFMVMELVKGRTLTQVLRSEGLLSPRRAIRIGTQICDALEAAHRLGIVHRDLKPGNVIILDEPRGRDFLKVLDFGLAKSIAPEAAAVTEAGVVVGTPAFVAPEAFLDQELDPRADLYALGVLFYLALSGRFPFDTGGIQTVVTRALTERPPPIGSGVPLVLEKLIMRLLEADPVRRYPTAADTRVALTTADDELASQSDPVFVPAINPGGVLSTAIFPEGPDTPDTLPEACSSQQGSPAPNAAATDTSTLLQRAGLGRHRGLGLLAFLMACGLGTAVVVAFGTPSSVDEVAGEAQGRGAGVGASLEQTSNAERTEVELTLVANPPAAVFLGEQPLGTTPVVHRLARGDAPVVFTFSRKGYRTLTRTLVPESSRRVEVELIKQFKKSRPLDAPPF